MTQLPEICQRTLESCVSGELPLNPELQQHLDQCSACAPLAEEYVADGVAVQKALLDIEIPPPPALEFRDALHSSSGYPRRVSLTVIPLLLFALLATALLVALYLAYHYYNEKNEQGALGQQLPIEQQRSFADNIVDGEFAGVLRRLSTAEHADIERDDASSGEVNRRESARVDSATMGTSVTPDGCDSSH